MVYRMDLLLRRSLVLTFCHKGGVICISEVINISPVIMFIMRSFSLKIFIEYRILDSKLFHHIHDDFLLCSGSH